MTTQNKVLIGVAAIGIAAYFIYRPQPQKASFVQKRYKVGQCINNSTYIYPESCTTAPNCVGGYTVAGCANVGAGTVITG